MSWVAQPTSASTAVSTAGLVQCTVVSLPGTHMVGAPTVGVVIDFQLLGDVQADPGAGIDVNGVELLG